MIKIENLGTKKVLVSEKENAGALEELHHQALLKGEQSVTLDLDADCTLIIKQRDNIFSA